LTAHILLGRVLCRSHIPPKRSPYTFVMLACHSRLPSRGSCMSHARRNSGCTLINAHSNFIVAITFPRLLGAFKPQGAFGWYAGWNVIGFFAILLFVPETKALSLEELDQGKHSLPLFQKTCYSCTIQSFRCRRTLMRHIRSRHCHTTSRSTSSA
jgi:hypothetical protein